jgi:beta-barrel assembly-enhancing protease
VKTLYRGLLLVCLFLALAGCGTLLSSFSPSNIMDTAFGAAMGNPSDVQTVENLKKAGDVITTASEEITPEQEYYIGRAVAATVLAKYKPYANQKATDYLNVMARGLSLASVLPETFAGYHVLILDSDDINAFGAPSGFILVSRGLLRCATSEDEVAAILAHEIGHVSLKHGLGAISTARWTEAGTQLLKMAAESANSQVLRDLTASFGGVISDIAKTMINSGYSQAVEMRADTEAVRILHDVGYDPQALVRVLTIMKTRLKPDGQDFAKTHPDPDVRIGYLAPIIKAQTPVPEATPAQLTARTARYQAALSKI